MSCHQLTIGERDCMLLLHQNQKDVTLIAQALGRSKSTISPDLHGNARRHGYHAYDAQNSYTIRRRTCKPHPKQPPEVVWATGKVIRSLEDSEPGAL